MAGQQRTSLPYPREEDEIAKPLTRRPAQCAHDESAAPRIAHGQCRPSAPSARSHSVHSQATHAHATHSQALGRRGGFDCLLSRLRTMLLADASATTHCRPEHQCCYAARANCYQREPDHNRRPTLAYGRREGHHIRPPRPLAGSSFYLSATTIDGAGCLGDQEPQLPDSVFARQSTRPAFIAG